MHDTFDKLRIHREYFQLSEKPVKIEDLESILDAARWAPSPFNSQPWEFLILAADSLKSHIKKRTIKDDPNSSDEISRVIAEFPTPIAVLYDNNRMDPGKNAAEMGLLCLGTCLGNFSLRAAELSIKIEIFRFGSVSRGSKEELEKKLKLPEGINVMAIIGMGYAENDKIITTPNEEFERYISEHIHLDRFGESSGHSNVSVPPIQDNVLGLARPRTSYRKHYLAKNIEDEHELQILKASYNSHIGKQARPPWRIIIIKDEEIRNKLAKRIKQCAYDAYMDKDYFKKMKEWMRFSEKEIKSRKDGVFAYMLYKYMGFFVKAGMNIVELPVMGWTKKLIVPVFSKAFFHDLVKKAPLIVAIVHEPSSSTQEYEDYETDQIAIGMAVQNILLSSWSLKVGVQFLSILFNKKESGEEIQKELGIPDNFRIVDMVRLGYIDPKAVPPQYFNVQGNVRRDCAEILHKDFYGNKPLL